MLAPDQPGHVDVGAWYVLDLRIFRFPERQRVPGVGQDPVAQDDHHAAAIGFYGDGMVGPGNLDGSLGHVLAPGWWGDIAGILPVRLGDRPGAIRAVGSAGRLAAVHCQDVAGEEAGLVRADEQDGVGDLVGLADALHGV